MPQMKPMNWLIIMLYTMLTFMMIFINMNYMKTYNFKTPSYFFLTMKNYKMKW